jgi:DNA-cytosine methyltransferase
MGINVLSFFDGISAGQEALRQLGVQVDNYFAIEIEESAILVTQKNFPNTVQVGDITSISSVKSQDISSDYTFVGRITGSSLIRFVQSLPRIDLVFAGSPCQGFSQAGKNLGFEDPRSRLFFNFIQIFNSVKSFQKNPNLKFFFENVSMKPEWQSVITNHLKVRPLAVDAVDYAACARNRLYWTNLEIPESIIQKYRSDISYWDIKDSSTPGVDRIVTYSPDKEKKPFEEENHPVEYAPTIGAIIGSYKHPHQAWKFSRIHSKLPCFTTKSVGMNKGLGAVAYPFNLFSDKQIRVLKRYVNPRSSRTAVILRPDKSTSDRLQLGFSKAFIFRVSPEEGLACMGFPKNYFDGCNILRKDKVSALGNSWSVTVVKLLLDAYCTRKGWAR